MSLLSSITGIGINPFGKNKLKINGMKALGTLATAASMGALGPLAGAMNAIPGAGAVMGGISKVKGALGAIPGVSKLAGGFSKVGGVKGLLGSAGGFLKDHGDQLLGAGAIGEGYLNQRKATDYRNRALGIAEGSYNERAPLRSAGVSGMLNEARPDLSSAYANQNPYSRVQRRVA